MMGLEEVEELSPRSQDPLTPPHPAGSLQTRHRAGHHGLQIILQEGSRS